MIYLRINLYLSIIETVIPPRKATPSPTEFLKLYIGGINPNFTTIPNFDGCMRGLKIGTRVFELRKTATRTNCKTIEYSVPVYHNIVSVFCS